MGTGTGILNLPMGYPCRTLPLLHLNVLLVPVVVVCDVAACLRRQLHGGQWTFIVYLVVSVDFLKKEQNKTELT